MKELKKSVEIAGSLIALVIGSGFSTPAVQVLEQYPSLRLAR